MNDFLRWRSRGISLRHTNYLMAGITFVISVLLLISTYLTSTSFRSLNETTNLYLDLKNRAYDLQISSDYLTEQVRWFVETGNRRYLDNYFEEAEVTRRRDKAVQAIEEAVGDSAAYTDLERAMDSSLELMQQEYYAMRLTIAAHGYALADYPEIIQNVQLDGSDARLDAAGQLELARRLVFNAAYRIQKDTISQNTQQCMDDLTWEMDLKQQEASSQMHTMLVRQQALIVLLILVMLGIVIITSLQIISPLVRAVLHIRDDQQIPVRGAYEFRFLAQTYNLMYEVHQQSKRELAFEASHDKLTGLYNRGGYDYIMENADLSQSALLLIDVDRFKEINDTFGHETGDRVLAWIASVVRGSFRAQDHVCRIGGDEFAVVIRPISPKFTDLIRQKIEAINARLGQSENDIPPASISVGVAFGTPGIDAKQLFEHADAALYEVKRNGREGCAFYGGEGTGSRE